MLYRPTVAMTLLSVAAGAKISMKPFEEPSMLSKISGIYFEPVVSTDNYCELSIPRNCGGKIDVDLSADSNIEFEWIASESMDKYISVSSPTGTIQFEFRAQYPCTEGQSQMIDGSNIKYDIEFLQDAPKDAIKYNPVDSFITLGLTTSGTKCRIFSRLSFIQNGDVGLSMDITKLTFNADYDASLVVDGMKTYSWTTNKFNWIQLEGVTGIDSSDISYGIKDAPIYPSQTPSVSPSMAPIATNTEENKRTIVESSGGLKISTGASALIASLIALIMF